jgi:hypothetical protein
VNLSISNLAHNRNGKQLVICLLGGIGSYWDVRKVTNSDKTSFFDLHYGGSSWHGDDAKFIRWMGKHWLSVTMVGFMFAADFGLCVWWVHRRIFSLHIPRDYRAADGSSPSFLLRHGFRLPLWRAWQWWNGKHEYGLAEQHAEHPPKLRIVG